MAIKRTMCAGLAFLLAFSLSASSAALMTVPGDGATAAHSTPAGARAIVTSPVGAAPTAPIRTAPSLPKAPVDTRLVIVRAKQGSDISRFVGSAKPNHGNYVLPVPPGRSTASYAAELSSSGRFEYATPDQVVYPLGYTATPNDPDFSNSSIWQIAQGSTQYARAVPYAKSWWISGHGGLGNTASPNFDAVWPHLTPDATSVAYDARAAASQIKVAVIDTGYYFNVPDASPNIVAGKDEFQSYYNGVYVTDGDVTPAPGGSEADHGTMVANEISQSTNNAIGGAGAGYDTQVRVYKVQGIRTDVSPAQIVMLDSAVTNAINDATDDGCRVITMSLGSTKYSSAMQAAITRAYSKGVVVCASSGNDGLKSVFYPAAYDHVIGVGSYSLTGGGDGVPARSDFTNWGAGLDLLAPGENLWGSTETSPGVTGYNWWSGTSMASPLVAAAAALTLRFVPDLGPDEVADVLQSSARDIGAAGYDTATGYGCLDMAAAYGLLKARYANLAKPVLAGVASGGSVNRRNVTLNWTALSGYRVQYGVSSDGSAPATSAATTVSLTNLVDGLHVVRVVPTSTRNWAVGSSAVITFTVDTVAPAAPIVSFSASTRAVFWTTSEADATVQLSLDTTASQTDVYGRTYTIPASVPDGAHMVYVRVIDAAGNIGPWDSVAFALGTTPPPTPVLTWDPGRQRLSWSAAQPGVTTQFALDATASAAEVSATSWTPPEGTAVGSHAAYVRMIDAAGNAGSWGGLTFAVADPADSQPSILSFVPPASVTVAWGAKVTLTGTLGGTDTTPVSGQDVTLETSIDGGRTWTTVLTAATISDGTWLAQWAPGRNVLARASYAGDAMHAATLSGGTVSVLQRVALDTPHTPAVVTHGHRFTVYSYLRPRATTGSHPVSIGLYRWEKHGGKNVWTLRKTVWPRASGYSSYTKCSLTTTVPYAGKWKAVARYAGNSVYTATVSGNRYLTAR